MNVNWVVVLFHDYSYSVKDEGRKRGGEEELTERGSGADGGLSSQIDSM